MPAGHLIGAIPSLPLPVRPKNWMIASALNTATTCPRDIDEILVHFDRSGDAGFGTLIGNAIPVFEGDIFGIATATGEILGP